MMRRGWETSNRTIQDVHKVLRKINDPEYIIQECADNKWPIKDMTIEDAFDFIHVQRELIKLGLDTIVNNHNLKDNASVQKLLDKEIKLSQYEMIVNLFGDDSQHQIVDWETFSQLEYIEIIHYLNSVWLTENASIEPVLVKLRDYDPILYYENYYDMLELIDISLINDQFLNEILPKGNEVDNRMQNTLTGINDPFDPKPYDIISRRMYEESITPSKAYFLFLTGLKKGIKSLDFATVEAYEISKIFATKHHENMLETMNDLADVTKFLNSDERFNYLMQDMRFLSDYATCVFEIVSICEDTRLYNNHYIQRLRAYLNEDHDLEALQNLANMMFEQALFIDNAENFENMFSQELLSTIDLNTGFRLVEFELYTYNIRFWSRVNTVVDILQDYISIKGLNDIKDQIWKWKKLVKIAEKFIKYSTIKKKEFTFKQIDGLVTMPSVKEKFEKVDEIISLIVHDTTGSLKLKLGKIMGNDTLMKSVDDALEIQNMLEGEDRPWNLVKLFADVVFERQDHDLPKILHSKNSKIYPDLEQEILSRLIEQYDETTKIVEFKIGDQVMVQMLNNHRKIIYGLDLSLYEVKNYIQFLDTMDLIKDRFTEDDDITSRIDLTKWYEYHKNDQLIFELFNIITKLENYDELIEELKNCVFISNTSESYRILQNALKSLLFRLSKNLQNDPNDNKDMDQIIKLLLNYTKQYIEEYNDKFDQIINIILKIVNISYNDESFITRKQDTLRLAVIFWDDEEIIETLANLYVDLIVSNTSNSYKEIIEAINKANQGIESTRLEQQFLCTLCNEKDDLAIIEKLHNSLELHQSSMPALKLLQKAMFLIKNGIENNSGGLKYYKTRNLIKTIKRQNEIVWDDMEAVSQNDSFYSINYIINNSVNEVQSEINEAKIQQKIGKLSNKKKNLTPKLNEIEINENNVLKQLLEAKNKDEVEEIVTAEL